MSDPSPGTERYWSELDRYSPEVGDLARIVSHDSVPAVYVLDVDHSGDVVEAVLLADVPRERREMLLDAEDDQRRALAAPIRSSLESDDVVELVVPRDDLEELGGGESA